MRVPMKHFAYTSVLETDFWLNVPERYRQDEDSYRAFVKAIEDACAKATDEDIEETGDDFEYFIFDVLPDGEVKLLTVADEEYEAMIMAEAYVSTVFGVHDIAVFSVELGLAAYYATNEVMGNSEAS